MNSQDRQAYLDDGEAPRWSRVGWVIPPNSERFLKYGGRMAHLVVESRTTGAWSLRCRHRRNLKGYRLVNSILGWPSRLRCRYCARIDYSEREKHAEYVVSKYVDVR